MDKFLGLATVGSAVANAALLHRLVSNLTNILALTLVGAFMGGVLLSGGFFAIYFGLVHYGFAPYVATMTVAALIVMTMAVIFFLIAFRMRQLRELSRYSLRRDLPGLSQIAKIAEAFMEGLSTPKSKPDD